MAIERWIVHFSGHVQGVGFRYRTQMISGGYQVFGWVANLSDGKVKVVAEGEESEISGFINEIQRTMSGYVREVKIEKSQSFGDFDSFEIRRGG